MKARDEPEKIFIMGARTRQRGSACPWLIWDRRRRLAACLAVILVSTAWNTPAPAPVGADSADGGAPFSIGERLVYRVDWNPPWYLFFLPPMEAGEAELNLNEMARDQDSKALKIVFKARSSGTLARLAGVKVDDYFEFLTDPGSLCTLRASKRLREGKRKRNIEVVYLPESRRLHIHETDVSVVPPRTKKDMFRDDVPECVQDPFSALYDMRRKELQAGLKHRSLVGNDDTVKEVESRVETSELVRTPSGSYDAWRINTVALLGGLFKEGGQFKIWLTSDERKIPVQFEAKVNLGRVLGKLKLYARQAADVDAGADHKPNSVSLLGRDGNHSSGPGIAPGILRSTREHRTGHPSSLSGSLSYLTLLRVGFAVPPLLPAARCALAAPFHPYPR